MTIYTYEFLTFNISLHIKPTPNLIWKEFICNLTAPNHWSILKTSSHLKIKDKPKHLKIFPESSKFLMVLFWHMRYLIKYIINSIHWSLFSYLLLKSIRHLDFIKIRISNSKIIEFLFIFSKLYSSNNLNLSIWF